MSNMQLTGSAGQARRGMNLSPAIKSSMCRRTPLSFMVSLAPGCIRCGDVAVPKALGDAGDELLVLSCLLLLCQQQGQSKGCGLQASLHANMASSTTWSSVVCGIGHGSLQGRRNWQRASTELAPHLNLCSCRGAKTAPHVAQRVIFRK